MGKLDGRVAFITGAARGQGRAHAVRMAAEGADLVLADACREVTTVLDYLPASPEDLAETVRQVNALDRRAVSAQADVRDLPALQALVDRGVAELGRLDVVVANAGISTWGRFWEMPLEQWQDMVDINLTGVFHTLRAAAPAMIEAGNGGSIICTSSVSGIKSLPGQAHYSAAKHGVVGLANTAAIELAPYRIRVNTVHPWGVATPMAVPGPQQRQVFGDNPSYQAVMGQYWFEPGLSTPEDIANAVLFLASDDARTITGTQLTVDHGASKT